MRNQIFVPTVAKDSDDVKTSWKIQEPLRNAGYRAGLMNVIFGGYSGVSDSEIVDKQYSNLEKYAGEYGDDTPIITMLSNMPIQEMDHLHNAEFARQHVMAGIDFSQGLPIGGRKIVTFHLNSLMSKKEFDQKGKEQWMEMYHTAIKPSLEDISLYANYKGVEVKVETCPAPEFGDIPANDEREYRGVKLGELRNPFYLTKSNFDLIRDSGIGLCLDVCHNRVTYDTAKRGDPEGYLFKEDVKKLITSELADDITSLKDSDIVHLNDGDGYHSLAEGKVFREGVALGRGDIDNLAVIVDYLDLAKIPWVLEVHEEGDFKKRPGSKKSIEWLLKSVLGY